MYVITRKEVLVRSPPSLLHPQSCPAGLQERVHKPRICCRVLSPQRGAGFCPCMLALSSAMHRNAGRNCPRFRPGRVRSAGPTSFPRPRQDHASMNICLSSPTIKGQQNVSGCRPRLTPVATSGPRLCRPGHRRPAAPPVFCGLCMK